MIDEADLAPARTEDSGFSPLAILIHVLGIAAGIFLGLQVMGAITPDLSTEEPGLTSSSVPAAVDGDDPDSLLQPSNLARALSELYQQLGDGESLVRLRITPGALESDARTGVDGVDPSTISGGLPQGMIDEITAMRPKVTLADVAYVELVVTADGPRWYIQLDLNKTDVTPPWTYHAPSTGTPVEAGGAPPEPLGKP